MNACIIGLMQWSEYVRSVIGDDRQVDVARKTGVDQTTISRWLNPEEGTTRRISSQSVAAFARGYGVPVLYAFVMAGFLTEDEAGVKIVEPKLRDVPTEAMLRELIKRERGDDSRSA